MCPETLPARRDCWRGCIAEAFGSIAIAQLSVEGANMTHHAFDFHPEDYDGTEQYPEHICNDGCAEWGPGETCPNCAS